MHALVLKLVPNGRLPLPRRDHTAILISNQTQMLVYGGINDSYKDLGQSEDLMILADLIILDLKSQ
jgi:hypothetical protein